MRNGMNSGGEAQTYRSTGKRLIAGAADCKTAPLQTRKGATATVAVLNNWFHGFDLKLLVPLGGMPVTAGQFISGVASAAVAAFLVAQSLPVAATY